MAGKGDMYRKVDKDKYDQNYERIFGKQMRGYTTDASKDFEVYAEVEDTEEIISIGVTANYTVEVDDPAHSPGSGNSMLEAWIPQTDVYFDSADFSWSEDTDDLGSILKAAGITSDFTLYFSHEGDDGFTRDGEDRRPTLKVEFDKVENFLEEYSKQVEEICGNFAEEYTESVYESLD